MTDDVSQATGTSETTDAAVRLVAAAAKAAPTLTRREARDVTAAVLRVVSEVIDEESGEGWPTADDLLELADDIEAS